MKIFPSLISADLAHIERTIIDLESLCSGFHLDVMDNHFVPNLTFGHKFINDVACIIKKQIQVHLMVTDPLSIIEKLELPPSTIIQFHIEIEKDIKQIVKYIQGKDWIPSVAISPKTPLEKLFPFLDTISQVLLMSVNPGQSGQRYLPESTERLKALVAYRAEKKIPLTICMDGGITETNIRFIQDHGADQAAIASGIFFHPQPKEQLRLLTECIR